MSDITLFNQDGRILASSREVAEKFKKNHDKVCRDIKNLLKSQPTKLAIEFIESEYISDRGRTYTEFLMARNGFSLLCMGFTGEKALEWKLKYIEAFNKMEEKLKSGDYRKRWIVRTYTKQEQTCMIETDLLLSYFTSSLSGFRQFAGRSGDQGSR